MAISKSPILAWASWFYIFATWYLSILKTVMLKRTEIKALLAFFLSCISKQFISYFLFFVKNENGCIYIGRLNVHAFCFVFCRLFDPQLTVDSCCINVFLRTDSTKRNPALTMVLLKMQILLFYNRSSA